MQAIVEENVHEIFQVADAAGHIRSLRDALASRGWCAFSSVDLAGVGPADQRLLLRAMDPNRLAIFRIHVASSDADVATLLAALGFSCVGADASRCTEWTKEPPLHHRCWSKHTAHATAAIRWPRHGEVGPHRSGLSASCHRLVHHGSRSVIRMNHMLQCTRRLA